MSHRGGREGGSDRGRGRGRPPSGAFGRQDRPLAHAPLSPQLKVLSKPLLSDEFLRFPRDSEICSAACDGGAGDGRVTVDAADIRRCAVLDGRHDCTAARCCSLRSMEMILLSGIDSSATPPPADVIVQMLLDRHSARVRVVEYLHFRVDFCADGATPGVRAVVIMFEDASACSSGLSFAPPSRTS